MNDIFKNECFSFRNGELYLQKEDGSMHLISNAIRYDVGSEIHFLVNNDTVYERIDDSNDDIAIGDVESILS